VAAQLVKNGLLYRAAIITEYIDGSEPLSHRLQQPEPMREQQWCRLGACLYRFHHANIYHADLNAHNILLKDEEYFLIDFDRGQRRSGSHWRAQNLARLQRSLQKLSGQHPGFHFKHQNWQALLDGYRNASILFGDECG
jgi:3-deoxy-D-manno-octulosonic acid kinase